MDVDEDLYGDPGDIPGPTTVRPRRNLSAELERDALRAQPTMPPVPTVYPMTSTQAGRTRKRSLVGRPQPRPIRTPQSPLTAALPGNILPSAPASPPTPAPSPTPHQRAPDWSVVGEHEGTLIKDVRALFIDMNDVEKQRLLAELLNQCNSQQLAFVHDFVSPRLKKDPFTSLPTEICLKILQFVDNATTLARASQVSKRWHELVSDDMAWKNLCEKHAYRRLSDEDAPPPTSLGQAFSPNLSEASNDFPLVPPFRLNPFMSWSRQPPYTSSLATSTGAGTMAAAMASASAPDLARTRSLDRPNSAPLHPPRNRRRPKAISYRSHFKQRYQVETAWRTGGSVVSRNVQPEQGVVTSLHLTDKYITVALDNAKIYVFDTEGRHQRTLLGHHMGVWAMVPWQDTLVSGGCDRDVRVWDMASGKCLQTLRGHTSTVRCLKMSDARTAISGSRDTTLRIWDIEKGVCRHVLLGHQASVRCLEIHGDLIVSGSYDTTARIWSISQGTCLRTLTGHYSQIYAIAFDGKRIATGSLDTSVRIWDPTDGTCKAVLSGHTSLVGQLQMRGDTLVTGGSDGSVRIWSLTQNQAIHRLAAHDNSVTSLQFDDSRVVSGGSDGRVKVWDLRRGQLVRELSQPADAVWRVVFEEEKAVVLANRGPKTVMEVWSFSPPPSPNSIDMHDADFLDDDVLSGSDDTNLNRARSGSPASMPDQRSMSEFRETAASAPPASEAISPVPMTGVTSEESHLPGLVAQIDPAEVDVEMADAFDVSKDLVPDRGPYDLDNKDSSSSSAAGRQKEKRKKKVNETGLSSTTEIPPQKQ